MKPKEIKTKFGSFYYYKEKRNCYVICDSEEWTLFTGYTNKELKEFIKLVKSCNTIEEWLENYEDVCWGNREEIEDIAKDYAESNDREYDQQWVDENFNIIGNTHVLFEYSEAYL